MKKYYIYILIILILLIFAGASEIYTKDPCEECWQNLKEVGYIFDTRTGMQYPIYLEKELNINWTEIQFHRIHLILPSSKQKDRTTYVFAIQK